MYIDCGVLNSSSRDHCKVLWISFVGNLLSVLIPVVPSGYRLTLIISEGCWMQSERNHQITKMHCPSFKKHIYVFI